MLHGVGALTCAGNSILWVSCSWSTRHRSLLSSGFQMAPQGQQEQAKAHAITRKALGHNHNLALNCCCVAGLIRIIKSSAAALRQCLCVEVPRIPIIVPTEAVAAELPTTMVILQQRLAMFDLEVINSLDPLATSLPRVAMEPVPMDHLILLRWRLL